MSAHAAAALFALWMTALSGAQPPRAVIDGQVVDATTGVGLADVKVQVRDGQSVATDRDGRFHLAGIDEGTHVLVVSVVGYALVRREVTVGAGGSIFVLIPLAEGTGTYTEHVEVKGELFPQVERGVAAQQVLGSADLQYLRGLVLDDPVRALHVLPGVASTDDFYADFSVRGVDFAHIGLAIDGVPSSFLSHTVQGVAESGSIGMINSDILERVSLMNGSYPQRFGDRTGAQVEMTLREGSRDRLQARVAVSGSSASIVTEGPLGRQHRGSWLVSARKSYLDLLIKQISDEDNFAFGFSDLAGKASWDLTDHQSLSLSAIGGHAAFHASQLHVGVNNPLVATNDAMLASLAWRYRPNARLLLSQHLSVTGAKYYNRSLARVVLDQGRSVTTAWRFDATATLSARWSLESSATVTQNHDTAVSRRVVNPLAPAEVREDSTLDSTSTGAYGEARWSGGRGAFVATGARVDFWSGNHETTGSPWVRGQVSLAHGIDVTGGTGIYRQFPDFNEVAGIRGTPDLASERAWQTDVGLSRRIGTSLRAQATVYARRGRNGIRLPGDDWRLVNGDLTPPEFDTRYINTLDERSSGVELLVQRRDPNGLSGWVSYTYGRTRESDRTSGERFDADFDQRHALNVYGLYQLTDRTNLSVKFRPSSNFPIVGYVAEVPATDDRPVPEDQPGLYAVAADRNTARLPTYSRLDLRANRTFKVSTGRLTLYVELLNVFGHTNWRTAEGTILPNGDLRRLLRPLVPFVPSAGLLWEF